jgi:integrase
MRLSEVLGLSWADVDFAAGVIHVRQQLARGRRGVPPHRIPPKTRASVREIPLLPQLAALLRQQKKGSRFTSGSDYVFATSRGTAFLHHNVSKRVLRRAAVNAGLDRTGRRLRFHDLRHTFASHLIIDIRLDSSLPSRAGTISTIGMHRSFATRDRGDLVHEIVARLGRRSQRPTPHARRRRAQPPHEPPYPRFVVDHDNGIRHCQRFCELRTEDARRALGRARRAPAVA